MSRDDLAALSMQQRQAAIVSRIKSAEIVGHGGGKFPTACKLETAGDTQTLIINGMQSEPANKSDLAALADAPDAVARGLALVAMITNASVVIIALPQPRDSSICEAVTTALQSELDWLNQIAPRELSVRFEHLPADYASGQEQYLAHALGLTPELLPPKQRSPLSHQGLLCLNVGTLITLAHAVYTGQAPKDRWVTINGSVQRVALGTPVRELVWPAWVNGEHSGAPAIDERKVDAGVFCITAPPQSPSAPCINCGACDAACPEHLLPQELFRTIEQTVLPDKPSANSLALDNCIECGACNAVCPSGLWLTQAFRGAKRARLEQRQKEQDADKAKRRVEARQQRLHRLEQEKAQRLQRRQQRERQGW